MVNQLLQQSKDWVLRNKVATFLSVALFAMVITTIALAVSNNSNASDLEECEVQLAPFLSTTNVPTTESSDATTSEQQTTTEGTGGATTTTTVSMDTSPLPEVTTVTSVSTTTTAPDVINYRLPDDTIPLHYDLLLHPDLEKKTFAGTAKITIWSVHATDQVVLHSHELLAIGRITFKCLNDSTYTYINTNVDREQDFLKINLNKALLANYISELTIDFTGRLDAGIVGFYSSSYSDGSGGTKTIATSKFEPTFARQAFPCFDEPHLKAEYTIHMVHPSGDGYAALSNMNVKETVADKPSAGLSTTTFERSVSMSTYLVVFIVSDFLHQEVLIVPEHGSSFPLRVYATPFQQENTAYALATARTIIEYYVKYFGIAYPLPKLDMAAIPDFVSGAMETWGLVTYRETSILYNSETSSTANKQRVAGVIAHELAHMWFGNLVTMKWWNELWLNEGFASYIEYKGMDAAHPDWGIEEQFIIDDLHGVLNLDATLGSHPIVMSVENPNQITEIFDTITYSKGASVIRMLEDFVTPPVFQQGVKRYLEKLAYANSVSEDLMRELDELVPDVSVTDVMDTFTRQKGLPVVTVAENALQYVLRQQRFLADQDANETEESPYGYRWYIPITYLASTDDPATAAPRRIWFPNDASRPELVIDKPAGSSWIKLNYRQIGYYRVNYPIAMWQQFGEALRKEVNTFTIGDRTGLLNDAFALADASLLAYNHALELTRYLSGETEYVPWSAIASKLKNIRNLLYNYQSYDDITTYTQTLVDAAVKSVGWEVPAEGGHMTNLLRTTILDLACSFGHPACLEEASKQFRGWLNAGAVIHPDLRSVVYTYGIQSGVTVADWDKVLERFRQENDANEKTKLMVALASYPDQRTMRRFLDLSWDTALVRTQDQLSCIQYIAANRAGEQAAWEHVRENWPRLVARFGIGERNLGRMIPSVTGRFTTQARLTELEDFFARYPESGAGATARRQALENIQNNISWLERNEANVAAWLKEATAPQ
ncbi:AGAP003077-PA [Anopheles gambiae str. PEST]|uniref:glutamyl aminopeptidase n=1 Tax=Anopheles gambiae TaxID=7165 RepID=Q7PQR3_ANOGA|nr:AGAP003077-PA [Anopheles gambiae str. PEST]